MHEAARAYASLLAEQRHGAVVWHEYGCLLAALDDPRAAVSAFESALLHDSGLVHAHNDRGVALMALSRPEEARSAFEQALRLDPGCARARANLGNLLLRSGEFEPAEHLYRAALHDDPSLDVAQLGLGRVLARQGRSAEARLQLEQAVNRAPRSFDALLAAVALELDASRLPEAIRKCERFLALSPWHSGALGVRAELERELGRAAAKRKYLRLLELDRWLKVHDLSCDQAWLAELPEVLANSPTLVPEPPHHATRRGLHSAALSRLQHPALARLEQVIEQALGAYVGSGERDQDWTAARPRRVALHSWCVVLAADGFQLPHLHPAAWLSGVFYVSVPPGPLAEPQGCLEFGPVDPELPLRLPRPSRWVEARPGRLVLFPSWLYHSTVPHQAAGLRVSVAFDCVAASS